MDMEWSPQNAMNAYLQTLHMCKVNKMHDEEQKYGLDGSKVVEPQGHELLSALAAGNQSRLILDISTSKQQHTNNTITPITLALTIASNQTNGKLISIRPNLGYPVYPAHRNYDQALVTDLSSSSYPVYPAHRNYDQALVTDERRQTDHVNELRVGDPCEVMNDIRNVDFVVIDCSNLDHDQMRLVFEKLDLNPKGAIIVATNVLNREDGVFVVDQVLKGKRGIKSCVTTLPLGTSTSSGFQVIIKIKSLMGKCQKRRRQNRFFVTFDE
ncbi:unnamed protein product [Amaranthus hypochondriacus]